MIWKREDLRRVVQKKVNDHKFIVVSNREPFMHVYTPDGIRCLTPASGMATALDPIMEACGGTWIAHGSGDADREVVDSQDAVNVPPDGPLFKLRRVWLSKEEENGYYYGYANEGLWPLSHIVYVMPTFREEDWRMYRRVNERFADTVAEELGGDAGIVFIQDYHFALLPRMVKERCPKATVAQFWHIPWPNREAFRVCPHGDEILDGMLGNDILGFHIRYHCLNFLDTVDRAIEARVDYEKSTVTCHGKKTLVREFPISIDYDRIQSIAGADGMEIDLLALKRDLGLQNRLIGLGIDRVDYTKGIVERFRAIDRLLEKYPQFVGRFVFLQLGPISRIHISEYKAYNDRVYHAMVEINEKWRDRSWQPILMRKIHLVKEDVVRYFRLADVCVVSSIHDGMNLVAKEFIASRLDERGVLVLSRFTGAARELEDALLVNPLAIDRFADTLMEALEMEPAAQQQRMRRMRTVVQEHNVFRWAGKILSSIQPAKNHE